MNLKFKIDISLFHVGKLNNVASGKSYD